MMPRAQPPHSELNVLPGCGSAFLVGQSPGSPYSILGTGGGTVPWKCIRVDVVWVSGKDTEF